MRLSTVLSGALLALFSLSFIANSIEARTVEKDTFTVLVRRSMTYQEIRHQAEQQTNAYISSAFSQRPNLESLRLNVLGKKVVEIVPVFSVFVTRAQWQESPHVRDWVSYNQASFSLLQSDRPLIARVEENPVAPSSSRTTFDSPVESSIINQLRVNNLDETDVNQLIDEGVDPLQLIDRGVNPQFLIDELD